MKKIVIVLLNLLIILSSMLLAQNPPDTLWTRTFGGSSTDIANSVIKTSDGGYIMAGKKHVSGGPGGNFDWYVVKTDEIGNYMWSKTYGEEEDDIAYYIDQTNDDGYIITGRFCAYARLIKTDNNGNEEWNKIFNGDGEWDASQSYCVQQTTDGGYILTGWYDDFGWWHLWLAKTDSLGDVIWLNNYWEPYDCEWGYSVQQTSDSGFILAGRNHAQDYCIIKTNNSGGVEWENHYCGTSYVDFPQSIKETNDNGYIVTGYYNDTDVNESILACKLDGNGNILWSEIYGGAESDKAYSIVNAHNGGYVMVGETESYSGNQHSDIWIIKIDENGNIVWDKTIGGSYWDYGRSIQKTSYGYILAGAKTFYGTTYEDFYLVYLEAESNIINIPDDHPTIQEGIDASVNGDTVLVQPGTYVENINYNGKNITVASLFLTTQDTSYISQTIIDGNQNGSVVTFESGEDTSAVLTGFTITNGNTGYGGGIHCNDSSPSLKSLSIKDNFSSPRGGGIYCIESSPCLENITITDNSTDQGGGLYCRNNSNPILQNVSITGNTATNFGGGLLCRYNSNPSLYNVTIIGNSTLGAIGWGGGIYCTESSPSLVNVTITDNSAWHGGGIHCQYDCSPNLLNSILWDNTPEEIYFYHDGEPNTITISYSDIDGGSAGIVTNNNGTVYWLEGNIDADPLFADPENGDYHLSWDNFPIEDTTKSPCIDAGDPDPQYNDPDGTRNDMGAYYFDQTPYYFDISGNIGYFSDGDAVPNTILELTGDNNYSTTTDESGDYYLFEIYGGSYISTPSKTNDLEGLSGLDASRIARFSAGLYAFDCMQWIASDVSLNGSTSGLDASRVARYSIGTITELNPEGINWTFTPEPIPECDTWPPIVYENTREYSPVDSDLTDEDFIGIRLGDVSSNWSPDARMPLTQKSIEATEIEASINSTLRIPIVIEEVTAIEGIDISIAFDSEVLQLTELTLKEGILDNKDYAIETNLNEPGKGIMVIYANRDLVSESGIVAFVEFDVIGEVDSKSEVYFTKFDLNETEASGGFQIIDSEGKEVTTKRLEVNIIQHIPAKLALYPNYPNPFYSKTVIKYDLPKDTHVNIQIYNIRGQLVKELVNGVEAAGRKQIEWNAKGLSSGIYFFKLSTKDKTFIKKMILMQ